MTVGNCISGTGPNTYLSWRHITALIDSLPSLHCIELELTAVRDPSLSLSVKQAPRIASFREIRLSGSFVCCYAFLSSFQANGSLENLRLHIPQDAETSYSPRLSVSEGYAPLSHSRIESFTLEVPDLEQLESALFWIRPAMVCKLVVQNSDIPPSEVVSPPSNARECCDLQIAGIDKLQLLPPFASYLLPRLQLEKVVDMGIEQQWLAWRLVDIELPNRVAAPNLVSLRLRSFNASQDATLFSSIHAPELKTLSIFLQDRGFSQDPEESQEDSRIISTFCLSQEKLLSMLTKLTFTPPTMDINHRNPFLSFGRVQNLTIEFRLFRLSGVKGVDGIEWLSAQLESPLLPELNRLTVRVMSRGSRLPQRPSNGLTVKSYCRLVVDRFLRIRARFGIPIPEIKFEIP